MFWNSTRWARAGSPLPSSSLSCLARIERMPSWSTRATRPAGERRDRALVARGLDLGAIEPAPDAIARLPVVADVVGDRRIQRGSVGLAAARERPAAHRRACQVGPAVAEDRGAERAYLAG